ncbi:MAG: hypothetical protein JJT95_11680 [Pararhodobacter sp.]|nr:hypothetical protein [Pararhodobacter sp.]
MRLMFPLPGVLVTALLACLLATLHMLPARADAPALLRFQPGSHSLAMGDPDTAETIDRLSHLLLRYGQGSSLSLLLSGQAVCPGSDCVLLRQRVDTILSRLAGNWPRAAGTFPADRLLWQAIPHSHGPGGADRLELFLRPPPESDDGCGAAVFLHDPALPPGVGGVPARLRLFAGTHPMPVSGANLSIRALDQQTVTLLHEISSGLHERIPLPAGGELVLEPGTAGARQISITLEPAEANMTTGRTIADQLQPWSGEVASGASAQAECRFQFGH